MSTVHFDPTFDDWKRRAALYRGELISYSPTPASLAFVDFSREMIREAFAPLDPELAQYEMKVEDYAELLGRLKPGFIHHAESKKHVCAVLESLGVDPGETYAEVPKLRTSTSDDYLTAGIAYAWHPHRDTWYSAPACQINWWIPIFPLHRENGMAFHPRYFDRAVANTSNEYNYYEFNRKSRGGHVTKFINKDPRPPPRATEPLELAPSVRLMPPVGGILIFSGAQMHSSVPNRSGRTRFSLDFRTAHIEDLREGAGAPRLDSECGGTVLREFLRADDQSPIDEAVLALYEDGSEGIGPTVFGPG